jgi:hypothetical protein
VTLPQGRNGLSARRRAVLSTFREPSLGRHVHRELLRGAVLAVTPIISATACNQSNDVERYSRFIHYLWSIIDDSGFVVSSILPSAVTLLSFHRSTGKLGSRPRELLRSAVLDLPLRKQLLENLR